jgi:hypothetical protein
VLGFNLIRSDVEALGISFSPSLLADGRLRWLGNDPSRVVAVELIAPHGRADDTVLQAVTLSNVMATDDPVASESLQTFLFHADLLTGHVGVREWFVGAVEGYTGGEHDASQAFETSSGVPAIARLSLSEATGLATFTVEAVK